MGFSDTGAAPSIRRVHIASGIAVARRPSHNTPSVHCAFVAPTSGQPAPLPSAPLLAPRIPGPADGRLERHLRAHRPARAERRRPDLDADGAFGPAAISAVKTFQTRNRLEADGSSERTPGTSPSPAPPCTPTPPLLPPPAARQRQADPALGP
ncbi:peptidoglycan-binding domain-containing protein [Streptomyces tanashiensis]|uniref:peptidoglycan-binding domain-containing protein n=1 Tax=Streptomyces tanashiensis TaxID=67367 RepID=UPI0034121271